IFDHPLGAHVMGSVGGGAFASGFKTSATPGSLLHFLRTIGAQLGAIGGGRVESMLFLVGLCTALVSGAVATKRGRVGWAATGLCFLAGLAIWLYGSLQIVTAPRPMAQLPLYNGLMVQLPMLCLVGLGISAVWRRSDFAPLRLGVAVGLLFLALEVTFRGATRLWLFTGGQWGLRELLPAVPAIVAAAVAAVGPAKGRSFRMLRMGWGALILAGLASSALSTWLLVQQKHEAERLQR
ncbi:unnamed protein product, partial [marine sediment metagenome]